MRILISKGSQIDAAFDEIKRLIADKCFQDLVVNSDINVYVGSGKEIYVYKNGEIYNIVQVALDFAVKDFRSRVGKFLENKINHDPRKEIEIAKQKYDLVVLKNRKSQTIEKHKIEYEKLLNEAEIYERNLPIFQKLYKGFKEDPASCLICCEYSVSKILFSLRI